MGTLSDSRDIDAEYVVWVRMFGEEEAARLRMNAEAHELLEQLDEPEAAK